ncbi:MAG: hypothetical protein KatS3mg090_0708 [Patescibacteria group bacterium]|nr:MAG: hypothetical protein KatS3mg090_0708 [Patescibacteria group bacterium]
MQNNNFTKVDQEFIKLKYQLYDDIKNAILNALHQKQINQDEVSDIASEFLYFLELAENKDAILAELSSLAQDYSFAQTIYEKYRSKFQDEEKQQQIKLKLEKLFS